MYFQESKTSSTKTFLCYWSNVPVEADEKSQLKRHKVVVRDLRPLSTTEISSASIKSHFSVNVEEGL